MTEYVVGFAFNTYDHQVALIRKNRPKWQAGKLNGIGGHIEPGEWPIDAMVREFQEETGLTTLPADWKHFVTMKFPEATIYFYKAWLPSLILEKLKTTTDEVIVKIDYRELGQMGVIPNLLWLVPLATYTADDYDHIYIRAHQSEAL
jgi:8-oxo-dGTP diphosphatase